jgi:hypothetical protein
MTPEPHADASPSSHRTSSRPEALAALVAARASALGDLYRKGTPLDASRVLEPLRGRFLASTLFSSTEFALRKLVRFVSEHAMPWEGLVFDHGGNAGANLVLGKKSLRFRAERGLSLVDGKPTLVMTYAKNPWPAKLLRDELRVIEAGVAIGPTFLHVGGGDKIVGWFGVTGEL